MPSQPDVPIDVIERAQSCSESAETKLFQYISARILPLAQIVLCRRQREHVETAEGIAQEVFVVMCEQDDKVGKRKYKTINQERLISWVIGITRNKIGDHIIRKPQQKSIDDLQENTIEDPQAPDDHVVKNEMDRIILKALQKLDSKCRQTILALIRKNEGFELPPELASLPNSTWHPRVHRCRKKFRILLRKEGLEI